MTEAWTEAYFGTLEPRRTWPGSGCGALCSEYGWSLWGFIQAATSPMDFDFHGWGHAALREGRRGPSPAPTSAGSWTRSAGG